MSLKINVTPFWYKQTAGIIIVVIFFGLIFYFLPIWVGIILGVLLYFGTVSADKQAIEREKLSEEIDKLEWEYWNSLGASAEERKKSIEKLFNTNNGTVSFFTRLEWTHKNNDNSTELFHVQFKISRNIAVMENREREFLKIVFLLFNDEKLTQGQYRYYTFAFVNGDGKASIDTWKYFLNKNEYGVKDGPTTIKYYQDRTDATVNSAVSNLLQLLEKTEGTESVRKRVHSGSAWLSEDETEGTIFNGNGEYRLSLGRLEESGATLHYSGAGSLMTIAPPGSGKTQCFVFPNLLNWKSAAVVLDIKPEIYAATHEWRQKNVGKVFKFDPLNPENSNSYNPLTFVRDDPDYIWEDAGFLAEMMIIPSGSTESSFWDNAARDVLTAAIAHVVFNNDVDNRPMVKVLDIMYGIGWDEMIASLKTNVLVSAMRRMGNSLEEMDKKQRDSVLRTAQGSIAAWSGGRMEKITTRSDWNPADIRQGSQTIYICIKAKEIDKYISVLRVFLAQHIQLLLDEKELKHDREKIASPILFMLDEFPQLKRMPPIEKALNVGAGYGLRLWMFAQSYGQLKEAYPNAEGLVGSCAVRTFMNLPITDEYTTKVSDMLGKKHDPLSDKEEPLVTPRALAGEEYNDLILVLGTGAKPAKIKKQFAFQDPEIMEKMAGRMPKYN